ncbi:unnamed protein product [Sphenostylis stenocarpa]|uniref:PHD-type domain-containing protein n=1 Tax=Sphenostylis stenocarpa TaxID=92480 RepID=A0AA86T573_9FABA|nr:unnamed protein product [Sphenostylis stenocarpa]
MEAEDGTSNGDNGERAGLDRRSDSRDGDDGGRIQGGNEVAGGEESQGLKDETINNGVVIEVKDVQGLNKAVDNRVAIKGGNGVAEGEEVRGLKQEAVNNWVTHEGGNGVAKRKEVWGLKNATVNNGMVLEGGNGVAKGEVWALKNDVMNSRVVIADGNGVSEYVLGSKNEVINSGVAIADANGVAYSGEGLGSKNEAVNNEVVIADGSGVTKGEEDRLKNGTVDNVVAIADGFGVVEGNSGAIECFRTYKRRKHAKSTSEFKVQENSRKHMEAAVKKPCDLAVGKTSKDYSPDHWGNVVLKHLYHSLGNDNGGMEWCIREALMVRPKISCASTMMVGPAETFKIDNNGQEHSSELECLLYRLQSEANGHKNAVHNGFSSEADSHGATERCQHVFRDILASEKFSSLCKILLENFQEMKPETVFDFSVINSRMKEQAYEHSSTLFLSDLQQGNGCGNIRFAKEKKKSKWLCGVGRVIQESCSGAIAEREKIGKRREVWQKLQNTGHQIVAVARSLSNMSKASFYEQLGISAHRSFEEEKLVESISHMKPEQTVECVTFKVGTCKHCEDKAEGADCLVCDSCEEMYHLSCIEPAVKEIPRKSWFCSNCTAGGIGCQHENCVVCERLNVPKALDHIVGQESIPTMDEKLNELKENSNCTCDGIQVSSGGYTSDCKICKMVVRHGKIKICGHSFCPSKYYHVRCLSSKQLKSYGHCWYCPSCICQVCLTDQDDDKIVLCDGCDNAYHIYCMKPPLNSIPKGKWFCIKCDAGIQAIRQARKTYESKKGKIGQNDSKPNEDIDKKWNKKRGRESDKVGGMDMLITAANTLNSEDIKQSRLSQREH